MSSAALRGKVASCMSAPDMASLLVAKARQDLAALRGMGDPAVFADEVFGFHAQQAIEKALKAWIAALGGVYPLTHDLATLLGVLSAMGINVTGLRDVDDFTDFAVQFRYQDLAPGEDPLPDRSAIVARVEEVLAIAARSIPGDETKGD